MAKAAAQLRVKQRSVSDRSSQISANGLQGCIPAVQASRHCVWNPPTLDPAGDDHPQSGNLLLLTGHEGPALTANDPFAFSRLNR
jgi:hypothetical protein